MARLSAASHLPPDIVRRVVHLACHSIWSAGGASASTMLLNYNHLRSVCWEWSDYVADLHLHIDMIDLMTRRRNGDIEELNANATLGDLRTTRQGRCYRQGRPYCLRQILSISLDSMQGKVWKERKEKGLKGGLETLFNQFKGIKKLQLSIECGGDIELATKFPALTHLYLASWDPPMQALIPLASLPAPRGSPPTLPPTLVRLDLSHVAIDSWTPSLPLVKVLTLDHVGFGKDNSSDSTRRDETCRQFFGSFPSLESIAFNGILRLTSDALTRLKVVGSTNLYLGECATTDKGSHCRSEHNSRTFVEALSRHFRCRIKHLYFDPKMCPCIPPQFCNMMPFHKLVTSRPGQKHPPYLAKLETLTVAPPRQHFLFGEHWENLIYYSGFEFGGLPNVELRRWKVEEKGNLVQWEPKSWCQNSTKVCAACLFSFNVQSVCVLLCRNEIEVYLLDSAPQSTILRLHPCPSQVPQRL